MFARTVKDYLMNPHRLSVFLEVARSGSVRGAADRLVVSQPAVTAAVRALEGDLRVSLVARQGRGIVLTSAGQVLAAYAARVLGLLEEARAAVEEAAEPGRGRVRLAAVTTAGEHVLPPLIKEFRSRFPEVEIALEVGNRRLVWDRLRDREADLAVAGRPPPGLSGEPFLPNDLVLVGPADMSLPREPAQPADVAAVTWLLREPGSGTRATAEEFIAEMGISPPSLTLGSNGAIVASVALGLGVTLISSAAVQKEMAAGTIRILAVRGLPLRRQWHVVTRQGERPHEAPLRFLEFLRSASRPEPASSRERPAIERGRRLGRGSEPGPSGPPPRRVRA